MISGPDSQQQQRHSAPSLLKLAGGRSQELLAEIHPWLRQPEIIWVLCPVSRCLGALPPSPGAQVICPCLQVPRCSAPVSRSSAPISRCSACVCKCPHALPLSAGVQVLCPPLHVPRCSTPVSRCPGALPISEGAQVLCLCSPGAWVLCQCPVHPSPVWEMPDPDSGLISKSSCS